MNLDLILDVDRRIFVNDKGGKFNLKPINWRDQIQVNIYPVTKRFGASPNYEVYKLPDQALFGAVTAKGIAWPPGLSIGVMEFIREDEGDGMFCPAAWPTGFGADEPGEPASRWTTKLVWKGDEAYNEQQGTHDTETGCHPEQAGYYRVGYPPFPPGVDKLQCVMSVGYLFDSLYSDIVMGWVRGYYTTVEAPFILKRTHTRK